MLTLSPGQRILNIPDIGVSTSRRAVASAAADWWAVTGKTCVTAYQAIGAASLAASYVNLANPGTYDAAPGSAPTFNAATGWTFNGSDQFLTIPGSSAWNLAGTMSLLMRLTVSSATNRPIFSIDAGFGSQGEIYVKHDPDNKIQADRPWIEGGTPATTGLTDGDSAVIGITVSNTALIHYLNGSANGTDTIANGTNLSNDATIGYAISGFFAGSIAAITIFLDALTAGEVATVSTAMAGL